MKSARIALIGCGAAAMRYYVPAFNKHKQHLDGLHLIDINTANAENIHQSLGFGQIGTSYQDVLPKVDGAIILLPNHLHHKVAMDCLNAGVHVLCEKPLAELPDHALEMVEMAEKNSVALCVNNTRRLFPNFNAVRQMLQSGELGTPLEIEYVEGNPFGWQSSTGFYVNPKVSSKGILLDLGSHVIDTLCWWLGGKPDLEVCLDDSYGGPESVVKVQAQKDNCRIAITMNRLCELSNKFRVVCEKGIIEGGIFDWKSFNLQKDGGKVIKKKLKSPAKNYPGFTLPVFANFIDAITGKRPPLIAGKDVLPSIHLIHECYTQRKHFSFSWDKNVQIPRCPQDGGPAEHDEKRILITGATGFVGGRIVEILHLAGNVQFRAVAGIRQWSSAARLGRTPVDIVFMDLLDKAQIFQALEGITHVIHCAKGTPEVTVEGTRNLLNASKNKGIKHFIHLSTADVYGDATGVVDESFPLQYTGNAYNKMKIDAEKVCWEYIEKGVPITIFRPSIIYGPYSNNWVLRFASLMLKGEWGTYEKYGEGKCNLVYIDDLVKTLLCALDNKNVFGKALNINGPEIITWNEYFTKLNDAMGLPALNPIPASQADMSIRVMKPVRVVGGLVKKHLLKPVKIMADSIDVFDALLRRVEHQIKAKPAADELKLFANNVLYSVEMAKKNLLYTPDNQIGQGVKMSVDWLLYLGKLTR